LACRSGALELPLRFCRLSRGEPVRCRGSLPTGSRGVGAWQLRPAHRRGSRRPRRRPEPPPI
jgi:hypothetical protein